MTRCEVMPQASTSTALHGNQDKSHTILCETTMDNAGLSTSVDAAMSDNANLSTSYDATTSGNTIITPSPQLPEPQLFLDPK